MGRRRVPLPLAPLQTAIVWVNLLPIAIRRSPCYNARLTVIFECSLCRSNRLELLKVKHLAEDEIMKLYHTIKVCSWVASISIFSLLSACDDEVIIHLYEPSSSYVCTGETVSFKWNISNIDSLQVFSSTGESLHRTTESVGNWTSEPIPAGWDFLKITGCQGNKCEDEFFTIHIIDNPKWTCDYFNSAEAVSLNTCGTLVGGSFQILGDDPVMSDSIHPQSLTAHGIYQYVHGYIYRIPASHFSPRATVTKVRFNAKINVNLAEEGTWSTAEDTWDPDGMVVGAFGENEVLATWVPKDQSLGVANPFHPAEASWILNYQSPQKILVAIADPPREPGEKPIQYSTVTSLFPKIAFEVKCLTASVDG